MKTRHGCGTHPAERITKEREKGRGMRQFCLFPDANQASPLNFHSVVPSRDVTALFFLVIGDQNRRNCNESNFSHCTSRRDVFCAIRTRYFTVSNKHRDRFRIESPASRSELLTKLGSVSIAVRLYS